MNYSDIYRFFNCEPTFTKISPDNLIISLLKEKFGFPISYTPESMDKALILTTEENLALYKDLCEQIKKINLKTAAF